MSRVTSHGTAKKTQLYKLFGVSRQAVSQAMMEPKPKKTAPVPRVAPAYVPAETLKPAIQQLVSEHPAWGVRKVWATLRRQQLKASMKRIHALMRSMGLTLPASPRRGEATRGHVAVAHSNRRWGTDLTTVYTKRDGWVAVVPVLDYGDRTFLSFEVSKSQDALVVLSPLQRALEAEFGNRALVPHGFELRTDHGPQYTGQDCHQLCWRWQVDHSFAPIGRPTGNSVVERFILTLKTELIWTQDWDSIHELQAGIAAWMRIYNYERPHQALGWQTPAERRDQNLDQTAAVAA
jgi:putative transposase